MLLLFAHYDCQLFTIQTFQLQMDHKTFSKMLSFVLILQSVMVGIIALGIYPEMHQN